ncbi:acyltransferase [Robbsia andropogonis]|uniref:acyltransferase n=1 Tax=Robbsia andropogonis TaxID=28092 RepID=UPI00209FC0C2|nr:acyltransferase [Robbsia andropogonis]MCP1121501.1 acyltransferase [Robbsia andropogonis]MCP1131309.1 acyltransferase [Robbsia andropogonis]
MKNLSAIYQIITTQLLYRWRLGKLGARVKIQSPLLLSGLKYVTIGNQVLIRKGLRLEVLHLNGRTPKLSIGNRVNIEQNVHIICHSKIVIGNDVSITGNCAVVDVTHPYGNEFSGKIGERILNADTFVEISDGCFIGYGAVIMPNVILGPGCVVGANSVVTRSFEARSVIAGSPAKLIKIY